MKKKKWAVPAAAGLFALALAVGPCAAEAFSCGAARGVLWGSGARAALPMTMTFQREEGLLVSRFPVERLSGAPAETAARGDLLYLSASGRLAVMLREGEAPEGSLLVGRMRAGRWMGASEAEAMLFAGEKAPLTSSALEEI